MVETSSDIDSALSSALREVNDSLSEQRSFAVATKQFQKQLLQDLNAANLQAQSYFTKLVNIMETATHSMLAKIKTVVQDVDSDLTDLREVSLQSRLL